jgi:hypothetical protein
MTDVPQHVLVARIILDYGNPALRFSEHFMVEWTLMPTALFYLLFIQLQRIVGYFVDAKIYLTVWVFGTWISVWFLAKARGLRDPWMPALAALPLTFCWYAYQGFLPFLMTIPLFTATITIWINEWEQKKKIALLWGMFIMLFGFHIVGAAAAVAVILIGACAQVFIIRQDRSKLIWAGISVFPAIFLTGIFLFGRRGPKVKVNYNDILSQVIDVIKFTCATLNDVAAVILFVWLCILGIVLVICWRELADSLLIFLAACFLVCLSIAMPGTLGSLWPAGPRLLPFAIILLIVCVQWAKFNRVAVVVSCILFLTGLSFFTSLQVHEIGKEFKGILSVSEMILPGKRVLPILVDKKNGSRWTTPFLNFVSIVTVKQGGSNPYVIAEPFVLTGASPLKYRNPQYDRKYAFMYDKAQQSSNYIGVKNYYDYVFLWGSSPDLENLLSVEMSKVCTQGKATIFVRHGLLSNENRLILKSNISE